MNTIVGSCDDDMRPAHIVPAISAIIPIDERGRHELLRVAASLAQGLPDVYARELLREAPALGVHPVPVDERLSYSPNEGTFARIEGRAYVLGRVSYLRWLHVEPHKAERDVIDALEKRGDVVYAVVAQHDSHCLGLIAVSGVNAVAAVAAARPVEAGHDASREGA